MATPSPRQTVIQNRPTSNASRLAASTPTIDLSDGDRLRVIAVDWSGRQNHAHKRLWLAEADCSGQLVRLESGRDRRALADHLLDLVRSAPPSGRLAIGLDFGFSYPAWFLCQLDIGSAAALWDHVARFGERWLSDCLEPFWGRPGKPRPAAAPDRQPYRRSEEVLPPVGGIRPKSLFQIGGAGAVGTGSIRGMPLLAELRDAGATIWPCVSGSRPVTVVEIYPRLLTRAVVKSRADQRAAYLVRHYPGLCEDLFDSCVGSEDAFDAAVSALVMAEHQSDLALLPTETNPIVRLEGRIWHPTWRVDRL